MRARRASCLAWMAAVVALIASAACGGQSVGGDDQDGMSGGSMTFSITVDDTAFSQTVFKSQNLAKITLTIRNTGTKPHGWVVGCLRSICFPDESKIPPIDPGTSAMRVFMTPNTEGIYDITSGAAGDTHKAQFVVQ